jgi:hypothetical protein
MFQESFFVLEVSSTTARARYAHEGSYLNREGAERFAQQRRDTRVLLGSTLSSTFQVLSASEVNARYNGGMSVGLYGYELSHLADFA